MSASCVLCNYVVCMTEEPSTDPAEFGQALRAAREAAGWTATTLAKHMAVTGAAVSNWERGLRVPTKLDLYRIEALLGVTPPGRLVQRLYPEAGERALMATEDAIQEDDRLTGPQKAALLAVLQVLLADQED